MKNIVKKFLAAYAKRNYFSVPLKETAKVRKQFYETLAKEGRNKLVFTINRDGQTVETLVYVGK
jgi:hypothetical protein